VKVTTHLHLVARLGICGAVPPLIFLRGVMLNESEGHVFMTWYLVKHRSNFIFTFTYIGQHDLLLYFYLVSVLNFN